MGRKNELTVDGVGVDLSKARFADTFEVAESDERLLPFDQEVVFVVVARVSTPSFREARNGDVSRVNVLKVREARLVRGAKFAGQILEKIGFDYIPILDDWDDVKAQNGQIMVEVETPEPVVTDGSAYVLDLSSLGGMVPTVTEEPEMNDEHHDLDAFVAAMNEIADEYENVPDDFEVVEDGTRRVVGDSRSPAVLEDPVLANFLR